MARKRGRRAAALLALVGALVACSDPVATSASQTFDPGEFVASDGTSLRYRLHVPERVGSALLPLIVFLHGSGGAGTDNQAQISGGNTYGTEAWTTPAVEGTTPVFVVAPQIPAGSRWDAFGSDDISRFERGVLELVDALEAARPIDPDRIYLVGQSIGGMGVWDLISKRAERFAAAVPVCGAGEPSRAAAARSVPVWAFHGELDATVPVAGSRDMIAALRAIGADPRYTEYSDGGHDVWTRAFRDPELIPWVLAQRRRSP
ncbi:MAG: dienelactone hydrolase family protein [Gemmatimonadota bacterium]